MRSALCFLSTLALSCRSADGGFDSFDTSIAHDTSGELIGSTSLYDMYCYEIDCHNEDDGLSHTSIDSADVTCYWFCAVDGEYDGNYVMASFVRSGYGCFKVDSIYVSEGYCGY